MWIYRVGQCHPTVIVGATILISCCVFKSVQLIWRPGTCRWNLLVTVFKSLDLKLGHQDNSYSNGQKGPVVYDGLLAAQNPGTPGIGNDGYYVFFVHHDDITDITYVILHVPMGKCISKCFALFTHKHFTCNAHLSKSFKLLIHHLIT